MRLDVVSIFPEYLAPLELSLIGRARRDGLIDLVVHDLRDSTHDRHRTVDDTPYGGGAGMVMKPEPWAEALDRVLAAGRSAGAGERPRLLVPTPGGVRFDQALAHELAAEPWLAFACGRYEGIDERVYDHASETLGLDVTLVSLGDYVLGGGEVAVLAMVEAVARLLPGVVGNAASLLEESHEDGLLEYPVYTKPASWDDHGIAREVPAVLLSGDHAAIAAWRHARQLERTVARRPDLLAPAAAVGSLTDLDVRPATPADAPEILVLQRACWLPEGQLGNSWDVPPLVETLEAVLTSLSTWTAYAARVPAADGSPGRLVGSVRGRVRPGDPSVWETSRLMVAPDLQGRGIGRGLLELSESLAPPTVETFWLNTGQVVERNIRRYRRAGYRVLPGGPSQEGAVDLVKRRR